MAGRTCCFVLVLMGLATPHAAACDGAEVLAAHGDVAHHIWAAPSPTPGYCYWTSAAGVTAFHATEADGYGNMDCPHPWLAHADADSLAFAGSFPAINSPYVTGGDYRVDLSRTLDLARATRLTARREVTGDLATDEHTATVIWPDGTVMPLLAAAAGPDTAQVVVPAGIYEIQLHVFAYEHPVPLGDLVGYAGRVVVTWVDAGTIPAAVTTWGGAKARFVR
jgi:hypothetical protein